MKCRLWHLLVAISILACLLALFDWFETADAVAMVTMTLALLVPIAIAPSDHRFKVSAWMASLYPALVQMALAAAKVTEWRALDALGFFLLGWPFSFGAVFLCMALHAEFHVPGEHRRADLGVPLLILLLVWLSLSMALICDPLGDLHWYMVLTD